MSAQILQFIPRPNPNRPQVSHLLDYDELVQFRPEARPMRGFFAGLSAEQKKQALEYRGEESHGDKSYPELPCDVGFHAPDEDMG
jgi:hypothetical protein